MQQKYREQVKCIYIDPPYNTGSDDNFPYKDAYKSSSWLAMFNDRVLAARRLMNENALLACHMDEHEHQSLEWLIKQHFGEDGDLGKLIWDKRNPKGDAKGVATQHEYVHFATNNPKHLKNIEDAFARNKENAETILLKAQQLIKQGGGVTKQVRDQFRVWINSQNFSGGEKAYCLIDDFSEVYRPVSMAWPNKKKAPDDYFIPLIHPVTKHPCPLPARGWRNPSLTMSELQKRGLILFGADETTQPNRKYLLKENLTESVPSLYYMGGSDDALFNEMGLAEFENPKPVKAAKYFLSIIARPDVSICLDYFSGSGTSGHAVIDLNREDKGQRKYILVEMGDYFDTVLKPRIQKVVYSKDWKDGKPVSREGLSHCFKTLRLESYEDTLNNLVLKADSSRDTALANNADLQRDYLLNYFLDVETQASQSLLNIADFGDPTAYQMNIKKPGSDEQTLQAIDLIETFNWLIGLWVQNMAAPHRFSAEFEREHDADLPTDQNTRLLCKRLKADINGDYWFRLIEGYTLKVPGDDTSKVATLIIWRKQTDDAEKDNAVLQKFLLEKLQISPRERTYGVIYINGSHTLPNPVVEGEQTKVRLIEEAFHNAMWAGEAN